MDQPERHSDDPLIVFDVGGVFIELNVEKRRAALEAGGRWLAGEKASDELLDADVHFRLGLIGEDAYLTRVCPIYGLTSQQVIEAEKSLLAGVFESMAAYARKLRLRHRVVCLSNTQAIHWRHIIERMLGPDFFDACYLSHEMGMEKPSEDIYRALQQREQVTPDRILFIDDTLENVRAAQRLGWHSIYHVDATQTIAGIEKLICETPRSGMS